MKTYPAFDLRRLILQILREHRYRGAGKRQGFVGLKELRDLISARIGHKPSTDAVKYDCEDLLDKGHVRYMAKSHGHTYAVKE